MSEPENAGIPGENPPLPPAEPQHEEPDLGPEVDDDFPTYANEANKELNRKVRDVTPNSKKDIGKKEAAQYSQVGKRGT